MTFKLNFHFPFRRMALFVARGRMLSRKWVYNEMERTKTPLRTVRLLVQSSQDTRNSFFFRTTFVVWLISFQRSMLLDDWWCTVRWWLGSFEAFAFVHFLMINSIKKTLLCHISWSNINKKRWNPSWVINVIYLPFPSSWRNEPFLSI